MLNSMKTFGAHSNILLPREMMEDLNTDELNQSEYNELKNFAIDTSDNSEYNDDVEDLLGDD